MAEYPLLSQCLNREIQTSYTAAELSLANCAELLERLNSPQDSAPIIHITGTKGKGSTAAMLAAAFEEAGRRVGVYSSPHIISLEERIQINGKFIPKIKLQTILEQKIRPIFEEMATQGKDLSFFEILTAAAFEYFAEEKTDCVILEVGMGGRTDATNVCKPALTVITNISLDHAGQLGSTLEEIAREKAGIIKPEVPVIVGAMPIEVQEKVFPVIHEIALQKKAPDIWAGIHFPKEVSPAMELGMRGNHQRANAAVVCEIMNIFHLVPLEKLWAGLKRAVLPGRMEIVSRNPLTILDAAHNPAAFAEIVPWLQETYSTYTKTVLFAASKDKDWRGMLQKILLLKPESILLTEFTEDRAANCREMETFLRKTASEELEIQANPEPRSALASLRTAASQTPSASDSQTASKIPTVSQVQDSDRLLLITGSFFLLRELYGEFQK